MDDWNSHPPTEPTSDPNEDGASPPYIPTWEQAPLEPAPYTSPKFCPGCGVPWHPDWIACPRCELANTPSAAAIEAANRPKANLAGPFTLYFILLGSLLLVFMLASENPKDAARSIILFDVSSAIFVLIWALVVRSRGMGPVNWLPRPAWVLSMPPAAIGTFLFAIFSMTALTYAFDLPEAGITDIFFDAGFGWTAIIVFVCLQPAIIEELAFRGVILHGFRGIMSDREAIIVSSLMFAFLHLNFLGLPYLFVVGAVAAWVRIKSGSLLPCMLLHFCHNFLVIAHEAGWLGF